MSYAIDKQPALGDWTTPANSGSGNFLGQVAGFATNPVAGIANAIGGLFGGGGPNVARINRYLAMLQVWYNEAISQGDVNAARAIVYYAQGGHPYPEQMQPQANALLMQMQNTAPRVYQAAITQGPWPKGQDDELTANVPRSSDMSLVGKANSGGISLSGLSGGSSSTLLLGSLAIAAILMAKK